MVREKKKLFAHGGVTRCPKIFPLYAFVVIVLFFRLNDSREVTMLAHEVFARRKTDTKRDRSDSGKKTKIFKKTNAGR